MCSWRETSFAIAEERAQSAMDLLKQMGDRGIQADRANIGAIQKHPSRSRACWPFCRETRKAPTASRNQKAESASLFPALRFALRSATQLYSLRTHIFNAFQSKVCLNNGDGAV